MEKEEKRSLFIIILSALALAAVYFLPTGDKIKPFLYLIPYLIAGGETLAEAAKGITEGEIFGEEFLMSTATVGALLIGEYPEAVFVMLFFRVGEFFEDVATEKSRKSITSLVDLRSETVSVERDGKTVRILPEDVIVGEIMTVSPGDKIALDGVVTEGVSSIDTSALTGESVPRDVAAGDTVLGGTVNESGLLKIRVTKPYSESTASKMLRLIESSAENKSRSEGFITRFAKYYTPAVVFSALAVAVIPPLFMGGWTKWIYRALNFLVISCPCALVISVPLAFFAGIGKASRAGVLVKGSNYLERLADAEIFVFDKTGTLTEGRFSVNGIYPEGLTEPGLLERAAYCESASGHPAARAIAAAYGKDIPKVAAVTELAGYGVRAEKDGTATYCGNAKLMKKIGLSVPEDNAGTAIYVAEERDGEAKYLGRITVSDTVKKDSGKAISDLRTLGAKRVVMLTGDTAKTAEAVGKELGIDLVRSDLLPADKVSEVERLMKEKSGALVFTGDGMNDAPVLARADVGVAMGALGSDAAIEAADAVIMDDCMARMPEAVRIAKHTVARARQNVVFSIGVKLAILILSVFGLCPMALAVFADVGVMVLAVLNAVR